MRRYSTRIIFGIYIALLMFNVPFLSCPTISDSHSTILSDTPWQDDTFCFIAYGDTRADSPGNVSPIHEELVGFYLQQDPELIIHTGDLVYHGGEWYQYADFNDSIQLILDYEVPFFTAVGNHEMYTDDWVNDPTFTNYTAYVDYSDVASDCGGTELHYSFDANGTHFIFLNTEWNWDGGEYDCSAAQMAWLEADLESTAPDDFVVVVFHRPPYSIRYNRPDRWAEAASIREEFHSLFVSYDVDLVFNGHDHLYYRTIRDGIYYVVTGGGGAPLTLYQTENTVWQEGDVAFSDYHYCVAKYESGYLNVEVVLRNGTIRDSFSLLVDQELAPTTPTTPTTSPTTPTTGPGLPPDTMLILTIGIAVVAIALVIMYVISKRK
ncbi:MAG: metallophosphoesterase family protein [Candidatus Thorarchaeota archaeon]